MRKCNAHLWENWLIRKKRDSISQFRDPRVRKNISSKNTLVNVVFLFFFFFQRTLLFILSSSPRLVWDPLFFYAIFSPFVPSLIYILCILYTSRSEEKGENFLESSFSRYKQNAKKNYRKRRKKGVFFFALTMHFLRFVPTFCYVGSLQCMMMCISRFVLCPKAAITCCGAHIISIEIITRSTNTMKLLRALFFVVVCTLYIYNIFRVYGHYLLFMKMRKISQRW